MLWTIARCSAVGGAATLAGPCAFGKSAGLSEDGGAPGAASTSSCRSLGAAGGPSGSFDCGGCGLTCSSFIAIAALPPPACRQGEEAPLLLSVLRLTGVQRLCSTLLMSKTLIRTICCKLDVEGHDAALAVTQRACYAAAMWIARVCW